MVNDFIDLDLVDLLSSGLDETISVCKLRVSEAGEKYGHLIGEITEPVQFGKFSGILFFCLYCPLTLSLVPNDDQISLIFVGDDIGEKCQRETNTPK